MSALKNIIQHYMGRNRPFAEKAEAELEAVEQAARNALDWLNKAPFDYSNGNTDPTGTIDEGSVRGWQGHKEVTNTLSAALKAVQE